MGKTTNALEVIKDYWSLSTATSVQEVKKYHNQVLLDLFEDDTNVFAAVKAQFTDLTIF
jgi:aspartate kinase